MNLIIKPVVTEKISQQTDLFNRYAFVVSKSANKIDIKKSVESLMVLRLNLLGQ